MYQEKYQLVVSGQLIPGMTLQQVSTNLATGFKFTGDQIKQVLGGKPRIIKTTTDLVIVKKLREKFISLGVNCYIKVALNEQCFRSAMESLGQPAPVGQQFSQVQAAAGATDGISTLSFNIYDFVPKLFSKNASEEVIDENSKLNFEIHREKHYFGWLLLIPAFAVIGYISSNWIGRILVSLIDVNIVVSVIAIIVFFTVWSFGVLLTRPATVIDITLSEQENESAVLEQTQKIFFRNKQFFLSTESEELNAIVDFDYMHKECICESTHGDVSYRLIPDESENEAVMNSVHILADYLKEISVKLFSNGGSSSGTDYNVYDKDGRVVATITVDKEITIKTIQPEVNKLYLLVMALVTAGA